MGDIDKSHDGLLRCQPNDGALSKLERSKGSLHSGLLVLLPGKDSPLPLSDDKSDLRIVEKALEDFGDGAEPLLRFIRSKYGEIEVAKDHTSLLQLATSKHFVAPGTEEGYFSLLPKGSAIVRGIFGYGEHLLASNFPVLSLEVPPVFAPISEPLKWLTGKFGKDHFNRMVPINNGNEHESYLRYAADPDFFNFLQNLSFESASLPLVFLSEGDTARNDDLIGIVKSKGFKQPDYHLVCGQNQYRQAFLRCHALTCCAMKELLPQSKRFLLLDVEQDFASREQSLLREITELSGSPILLNLLRERNHYYSVQHQYYVELATGHFVQIGNLQLDLENGKFERFNISTLDEDGVNSSIIIHGLMTGRDLRLLSALLSERIVEQQHGIPPTFPLELSPYQYRILPLDITSKELVNSVVSRVQALSAGAVRVMSDDRDLSLGKRVKEAGIDWVPFVIPVGASEVAEGKFSINNRYTGQRELIVLGSCSPESFVEEMAEQILRFHHNALNNSNFALVPKTKLSLRDPFGGISDLSKIPYFLR